MSKTPLYYHKMYGKYGFGSFHPFDPKRFPKFIQLIKDDKKIMESVEIRESPRASDEDLMLVHTQDYIKKVEDMEGSGGKLSGDTPVKEGAPEAARRIVGGSLEAAKNIDKEGTIINLGGLHHAGRSTGEGFCIFNDVAVAAQYLVNEGKKVCVLDTDAHQGNGTMDIFYETDEVLFISLHQDPRMLYPGTGYVEQIGDGNGEGYTVNIPLPRDSNIADYYHAFEEVVKPIIKQYDPDVLIRNGGSDPHHTDSLTDLAMDMRGLEYLGGVTSDICRDVDAGHIDLFLSGYGLRVIEGWQAILKGVLNLDIETPSDQKISDIGKEPKVNLVRTIDDLKKILEDHWKL